MGHRDQLDDEATAERALSNEGATALRPQARARLVPVRPAGLPVLALGDELRTIGRQAADPSTFVLSHRTISRAHVELRYDAANGRHWARDLGSRNGTWLAGQALGSLQRPLEHGAVLRIGDVLTVYEVLSAAAATSDPPEVDRAAVPGEALALRALRSALARAATRASPALVIGETGTGKERIAAELHRLSGRRGELVVANCAALSPSLIESQLFGHGRGAFTGASQPASGLFRAAEGGTLFLDEIGELPLELQPKLLRAIEYGEIMPVGASRAQSVDVRVVGVTNRDLAREVEAGRFRRDLYARLALAELRVPPLRERRVDLLAWLDRLAAPERLALADGLSAGAAEAILLYPWPDNLRGLHRLVLDCADLTKPIAASQLPAWLRGGMVAAERTPPEPEAAAAPAIAPTAPTDEAADHGASSEPRARRAYRTKPPREELVRVLEENGWSIRATARHYDRDRKQISRWVEHYQIALPHR